MNIITKDLLLAASEVCTTPMILVCFHRMPKVNVDMRVSKQIWLPPMSVFETQYDWLLLTLKGHKKPNEKVLDIKLNILPGRILCYRDIES